MKSVVRTRYQFCVRWQGCRCKLHLHAAALSGFKKSLNTIAVLLLTRSDTFLFSDKMEQQNAAANELFTKIQLAMTNQWRPEEFKRLKLVLPKHGKEKNICMM